MNQRVNKQSNANIEPTKPKSTTRQAMTRPSFLTITVLASGLLLTLFLWQKAIEVIANENQERFEQEVSTSLTKIEKRMEAYQQVLRGIKGLFVASESVDRAEFRTYTEQLDLEQNYPGILGVGYALSLASDERAQHIDTIRAEGFPQYTLKPQGERDHYSAIVFLEPFSGNNLNAFGYDMYSEKVRREAMDKSRLTNKLTLSGKVSLVQDVDRGPISGVLLYLPLYQDIHKQIDHDSRQLLGWVYAPFSMDILMDGIQLNESVVHLRIYDGPAVNEDAKLYSSVNHVAQHSNLPFYKLEHLDIAQRTWTIELSADSRFAQAHPDDEAVIVLFVGSLFSILMSLLVWSLSSSKERAESRAEAMNKELSATEFRWKSALSGAEHGVWDLNTLTNEMMCNSKWKSMLGYADDDIKHVLSEWQRLLHPQDRERAEKGLNDFIAGKSDIYNQEYRLQTHDGQWLWILSRGAIFSWTDDGHPARIIGTHTDITTQKNLELALTESDQRFRGAFETAAMGMALFGLSGEWISVNQSLLNMLQYEEEEELLKLTFQDITHPEDLRLDLEHLASLTAGNIKSYQMEKRYFRKDGAIIWVYLSVSMVTDGNGEPVHYVAQIENITDRKELEQKVLHQAGHDELTGLPNRRLLKDRLSHTHDLSHRYKRSFGLMYIDVDHFKEVNDEYGHDVGDELLKWLANKISYCIRASDTLARQGGDEFVLIMSEITSSDDTILVAHKMLHALKKPFISGDIQLQISLSIGIVISDPESTDTIDDLLRKADTALYQVKRSGRNGIRLYQDEDQ